MAQLVILGHKTRSKEVIEILEMLGGKNTHDYACNVPGYAYIINEQGIIGLYIPHPNSPFAIFTLEEFLEKFPYKVGDKVLLSGVVKTIKQVCWNDTENEVIYKLKTNVRGFSEEYYVHHYDLKPYKEETMDKVSKAVFDANAQCCDITNRLIKEETMEEKSEQITVDIPNGYEFFGIDDNNKIVLTKKQLQYPKTYKECCGVLDWNHRNYDRIGYKSELLCKLQVLLLCRDAYWKIAGEQMGLGKPWEQDYDDRCFIIANNDGDIHTYEYHGSNNVFLAFPTAEMRDVFYENFKELIELCKELL